MSTETETPDSTLDKHGLNLTDFTPECRDFLRALHEAGGEADTTELRNLTSLKRKQIHYRYDKLEELGVIDVSRAGSGHEGWKSNTATLTDAGREIVEKGALDAITEPNSTAESLQRQLSELRSEHENFEQRVRRSIRSLDDDMPPDDNFTEEQWDLLEYYVEDEHMDMFENQSHQAKIMLKALTRQLGIDAGDFSCWPMFDDAIEEFQELDGPTFDERLTKVEQEVSELHDRLDDLEGSTA